MIEIVFCGILTGLKKKKEDKRKQLGNGNIDSSWAAKSS